MRAAKSFKFGDGEKSHEFKTGDEVPDKIVKALDKDGLADRLILEKAAKANPDQLTREQLMELAGINSDEVGSQSEMTEESMREGFQQFNTKGDLVEWAEGVLAVEGLSASWKREEIEDAIVEAFFGEGGDENDEE